MDVREKLVELLSEKCMETCKQRKGYVCSVEECKRNKEKCCGFYSDHLIANGVTVQEWISVEDRLPQYTDEYNVTVGVPSEFGYFEKVKTLRFERIKGKEPRWVIPNNEIYNVIAWMELPKKYQPPKGE